MSAATNVHVHSWPLVCFISIPWIQVGYPGCSRMTLLLVIDDRMTESPPKASGRTLPGSRWWIVLVPWPQKVSSGAVTQGWDVPQLPLRVLPSARSRKFAFSNIHGGSRKPNHASSAHRHWYVCTLAANLHCVMGMSYPCSGVCRAPIEVGESTRREGTTLVGLALVLQERISADKWLWKDKCKKRAMQIEFLQLPPINDSSIYGPNSN